jgi:uncharacterized protein (DUF952 family)
MSTIWHIAYAADWEAAKQHGQYAMSTRGATLAEVGFVHAGHADQVPRVAEVLFSDEHAPLVVLGISTEALATAGVEVREEPGDPADPGSERFPHAYGAIPVEAVVEVRDVTMVDGRLTPWDS